MKGRIKMIILLGSFPVIMISLAFFCSLSVAVRKTKGMEAIFILAIGSCFFLLGFNLSVNLQALLVELDHDTSLMKAYLFASLLLHGALTSSILFWGELSKTEGN